LAPYNNVLQNEVELSKANTDKIKILNLIKNLITQLNIYRSVPFDKDVEYVGVLQHFSFTVNYDENSAITTALLKRPELLIGKKSIEIAEKDAKETFSQYYPRITLDYTRGHQKTYYENYIYSAAKQDSYTIGINLRWNIFGGGTTTYSYWAALRHIAALEKSLENQIAEAKAAIVKAVPDASFQGEDHPGSYHLAPFLAAFGVSSLCRSEDSAWRRRGNGKLSPLHHSGFFLPGEDDLSARGIRGNLLFQRWETGKGL